MKLSEGDKIGVKSGTLPNIEAGTYWVAYISYCQGSPYYGLRKLYGRCINGRFFTNAVDSMLGSQIRKVSCTQ